MKLDPACLSEYLLVPHAKPCGAWSSHAVCGQGVCRIGFVLEMTAASGVRKVCVGASLHGEAVRSCSLVRRIQVGAGLGSLYMEAVAGVSGNICAP